LLEAAEIDPLGRNRENVAGLPGQQRVGSEQLAQRRDRVLEGGRRRSRRLLAPERLDQELGRDDVAGAEQQHGEHGALLLPAERQRLPVVVDDLERTEHAEGRHGRVLAPAPADCERPLARRERAVRGRFGPPRTVAAWLPTRTSSATRPSASSRSPPRSPRPHSPPRPLTTTMPAQATSSTPTRSS